MRCVTMTMLALAAIGCGQSEQAGDGGMDLAVPGDLSAADLATTGGGDLPFGTDTDGGLACVPPPTATRAQSVWNAVTVPMQRADYAFDLNGDGRDDNQYGVLVGTLAGQGLPMQMLATQAITSGQSITLFDEQSKDATFTTDSCAVSTMYAGVAMASPDYSGAGHFTIDTSATVGDFFGPIAAARFTSEPPPAIAKIPSEVRIYLPLFGPIPVDIVGARLTYARAANGTVTGGQLNGAIRKYDVDHTVVPGLAAALNAQVQAQPSSMLTMQVLSIFDNGGAANPACSAGTCRNLDGSCAVARDITIGDCEVATNGLVANLIAPDVQLFDATGNYHPSPANTAKDSWSIGLGFTAVGATF